MWNDDKKMILHIANGSALKKFLRDQRKWEQELIAFNESVITGPCGDDIFSEAFFAERANALRVSEENYQATVVRELAPLFLGNYGGVQLWFDDDMFSQMNALTLFAYFDQIGFTGEVKLHLIQSSYWKCPSWDELIVRSYRVGVAGYKKMYEEILVNRNETPVKYSVYSELKEAIRLFKEYLSPNGTIQRAVRDMMYDSWDKNRIVKEICRKFPQYGIGDYNILRMYDEFVEEAKEAEAPAEVDVAEWVDPEEAE